jgi:hypothetical protein
MTSKRVHGVGLVGPREVAAGKVSACRITSQPRPSPTTFRCSAQSIGRSVNVERPVPRGRVPSIAALTISGARNASDRIIRTDRSLRFSRCGDRGEVGDVALNQLFQPSAPGRSCGQQARTSLGADTGSARRSGRLLFTVRNRHRAPPSVIGWRPGKLDRLRGGISVRIGLEA